jgi:hypothetical protein
MSAILLTSWGANSAGALVGGLMLTTLAASATLLWAGGFVAAILVVAVLSPTIRGAGAR